MSSVDEAVVSLPNQKRVAIGRPNSDEAVAVRVAEGLVPARRVWSMLAVRCVVPFGLQMVLLHVLRGEGLTPTAAAAESAAYWLWFVTLTNVLCIGLLARFARDEGIRLRDIYSFDRATWRGDLAWLGLGVLGSAALAGFAPSALASALLGDPAVAHEMLFRPVPVAFVYPLFVLMPITHALAELPTYFGYVAPRLRGMGLDRWVVLGIVSLTLSIQHLFFGIQYDWRYMLWLAVKFLPFALFVGWILMRRQTTMPYLMVTHGLLDASLPVLLYLVSTGTTPW